MPKAKRIEDMSDAELSRLSGKAYDEAMPEPDTTFGKLGRKAAGAAMAPAGALLSAATLGANPRGPSVIDAAKYGGKSMYHAMTGNKKAAEEADKELKQDVDRAQSVKRQRNEGENTNAMGDTFKKGGKVASKYMSFSKTGKPAGMKEAKKMSAGGYTRAADGIAQRGKTRGKMC